MSIVGLGKALRMLGIPDSYVSAFSVLFRHKKRKEGTFGVYVLDEKDLELIKRVYERAKKEKKKGVYINARIKKIAEEEKKKRREG